MSTRAFGFTIIEILITIAILIVIGFTTFVAFQNIAQNSALRLARQDVVTTLTKARGDTLASKSDTVYGVHIEEDAVVYFVGTTYNSAASTNLRTTFEGGVYASASLGGASTTVFARLSGEPSRAGTIVLTEPRTNASTTVTIYASGLIE